MAGERQTKTDEKETGRIESFSDGVFAVAITLLVFGLQAPHLPAGEPISVAALGKALSGQWPSYFTFVISFATILIMWINHHGLFKLIYKSSTAFLFANGFLLMLVTIVPFPTSLVGDYLLTPAATLACAVYAGIFVFINTSYILLWRTASHQHRLLKPGVTAAQVRQITRSTLLGLPLYLLATALAFWNAYVSVGICCALWIFWGFTVYEQSPLQQLTPKARHTRTTPGTEA